MEKTWLFERAAEMSLGLGQHLKGAWPNVRTESKVAGK